MELLDYKNGIARQNQYEDWNEMVNMLTRTGKYPFKQHDMAAERYAQHVARKAVQECKNKIYGLI